eukprot:4712810-Pleurochrysis_carterae.AAC.2
MQIALQLKLKGVATNVDDHHFESPGKRVSFPGFACGSFGNLVFIRDCYPPLLRRMFDIKPCFENGGPAT